MTKTISVRLDEEAMRALQRLEAEGRSRSEAIREALLSSANQRETLRQQAERVASDPAYRREVAKIQAIMDELSEPW
jgi:Arc/MetJ-type ribon-helix-helix transcriptional regulator